MKKKENISHRLRKARVKAGLNIGQMAALIGVPRSTYQKWEYGIREPRSLSLIYVNNVLSDMRSVSK